MEDVKSLVREEGRTARNLVAFNVPVTPNNVDKITKKPPSVPRIQSSTTKRCLKSNPRVRSASTGRDKKSELHARYWTFLFGNLQRAVDGIYETCEEDENVSECKEVIMVLENYTRDFHNLIKWFEVKWAYENTVPPLRRTSLAWEVRKTSPCRTWSSGGMSKPNSPRQKSSPTGSVCKSPVEQTIIEDKVEEVFAKENESPDEKKQTENVSDVEKRRNFINKSLDEMAQKEKEKESLVKVAIKPAPKRTIVMKNETGADLKNKAKNLKSDIKKDSNDSKTRRNNQSGLGIKKVVNNKELENMKNEINSKNRNVENKDHADGDHKETRTVPPKSMPRKPFVNIVSNCDSIVRTSRMEYSAVSKTKSVPNVPEFRMSRSKTTLGVKSTSKGKDPNSARRNSRGLEITTRNEIAENTAKSAVNPKNKEESDGWQTVRSRYRRGSTNLNMSTRFYKPSNATSLPALCIETSTEKKENIRLTPDNIQKPKKQSSLDENDKNLKKDNENKSSLKKEQHRDKSDLSSDISSSSGDLPTSTSMIAAVFKSEAELLEKRIQQFMAAQAERERIILEEEMKTEEADSQRSKQLSDEEESLQRQIEELELTEIDVDTETDETDGELVLETEEDISIAPLTIETDMESLENRYENMLEGMSWAERMDTLTQLQDLVIRHPGRALELHQKLSSQSRKKSLPEMLRRYQAKQACAQDKREKLMMEKSQRLRELLNKVEDVKCAKNQLIEDKRIRMEMKLKRAEENRTQHLMEIVRKAHDEDSKLKEIAFINELEAQNKRHDFMALCQEQEERLQGIHEERQRRQEEKAAKEAAAEVRRKALEAERQLRIQKMRQARREREERVGKMQLEKEKERQEQAKKNARDREERLSALYAAQLANQEELQKKITQKQQESARRHVENIEHIRQRAVESSILKSEEVPPILKSYPAPKQCSLCHTILPNEVFLLSHLKGKTHLEAVRKAHDGREPCRDELQRFNIAQIRDNQSPANDSVNKAAREKLKALKRRARKIKQRMTTRGQEWEDSSHKSDDTKSEIATSSHNKFRRALKELDKLAQNHVKSSWSNVSISSVERHSGELSRCFAVPSPLSQLAFRHLNGFDILTNLLNLGLNGQTPSNSLPNKSIVSICRVYKAVLQDNPENIESVLMSNKVLVILDLLLQRLEAVTNLDDNTQAQEAFNSTTGNGSVVAGMIQLLCCLIPETPIENTSRQARLQDIIVYLMMGGLIERVHRHSQALIETDYFLEQEKEAAILVSAYDLLCRICYFLKRANNCSETTNGELTSNGNNNNANAEQSTTEAHLLGYLFSTEAAGAIGTLYAAIALTSQSQKGALPTLNQIGPSTPARLLAARALKLLRMIAELDLNKLQNFLGAEGTSLQWRLIASCLIMRLSRDPLAEKSDTTSAQHISNTCILTELFTVLGYFSVNNVENQSILQSAGAGPSVLQQLCTLPFPFYGDPHLANYTLSVLLAATHANTEAIAILSCELSYQLLEKYKNSDEGKSNPLVRLLKSSEET